MKNTLLLLTVLCIACSNPQAKLKSQIEEQEHLLNAAKSTVAPDKTKGNDMIKLYVEYADKFPDDTLSATYLFRAGDVAQNLMQREQSLQMFQRVLKYENSSNRPLALFNVAFIYEDSFNDKAKAKPYYEEFVKKYPDHELADDVQSNLSHFNKTDEELIREFEMKNLQKDTLAKQ
jgi:TolA-binding protein